MLSTRFRTAVLTFVLGLLPCAVHAGETSVLIDGFPGDYVTSGQDYLYTPETAEITATYSDQDGLHIHVEAETWWDLYFQAPNGALFSAGDYAGATRFPFQDEQEPGLSVFGRGRGCNELTGFFTVHEITFGPANEVMAASVTFTQFCDGASVQLSGDARFNATPTPVQPSTWGRVKTLLAD